MCIHEWKSFEVLTKWRTTYITEIVTLRTSTHAIIYKSC